MISVNWYCLLFHYFSELFIKSIHGYQRQQPDNWVQGFRIFLDYCQKSEPTDSVQTGTPSGNQISALARYAATSNNHASISAICANLELTAFHLALYLSGKTNDFDMTKAVTDIIENEFVFCSTCHNYQLTHQIEPIYVSKIC